MGEESKRAMAQRHVEVARQMVSKQRTIIAQLATRGLDTAKAEELLATFERTLAIFEDDLERSKYLH